MHTLENPLTNLIQAKSFAVANEGAPLAGRLLQLLDQQKRTWPQLAAGYASLADVLVREVVCSGYSAWLQFNPGRIVSTSANVDARSIRERRCFLCVENLPEPQKGIPYKDEFLILCNPAPIFAEHFTISHIRHIPQALEPSLPTMLDLARDLSPRFTVFYNGPRCGASAPDHLHFQANPTGVIPVELAAQENGRRMHQRTLRDVQILTLKEFGRQVIVLESGRKDSLVLVVDKMIASLRETMGTTEEPMVNVLCSFADGRWRVIVFPRSKHRPEVYFKPENERVMVSPAAVDIGGLVVTPLEKDFRSISSHLLESIFAEVCLPDAKMEEAIRRLAEPMYEA